MAQYPHLIILFAITLFLLTGIIKLTTAKSAESYDNAFAEKIKSNVQEIYAVSEIKNHSFQNTILNHTDKSIWLITNDPDTIESQINVNICQGLFYEGYNTTGIYVDTFITAAGIDSIRTLNLTVLFCCDANSSIYGSPGSAENGLSIAADINNSAYYVAGIMSDSVMIIKFDLDDQILWTVLLDAVADSSDYPVSLIVDSEGMLVVSGMATSNPGYGGTAFILRFDPNSRTLLWSREILSTGTVDRVHGLSQNGPGGNYLLTTNPLNYQISRNYFQPIEIDRITGLPVSNQASNYIYANSAYIFDLTRHGQFLYGTGRFTLGASNDLQRYAITKLDAVTLDEISTYVGHKPQSENARLYGFDLIIDNNFIYTGIYGDPNGSSITDIHVFIQKSTLDGQIVWLKQYDLPLDSDFGYELVKSGNDLAVLANHRGDDGKLYLFKVNTDGNIIWAKQFGGSNINTTTFNHGGNQLIAINNDLIFIATADNLNGEKDMVVIHTDGDGKSVAPCFSDQVINITVTDILNPVFYPINLTRITKNLVTAAHTSQVKSIEIVQKCITFEDSTELETSICMGESFESYTTSGIYQDTFITFEGCDSLRILELHVLAPELNEQVSICSGGSYEGHTEAGMYTDTLDGQNGECDTVRHINLSIEQPVMSIVNEIIYNGVSYDGYDTTGIYIDTLVTSDGCDSIRILDLVIQPLVSSNHAVTICVGESIEGYTESGIYIDTLQTYAGCDSVRELTVQTIPPVHSSVLSNVCEPGSSFDRPPGNYIDTLTAANGCDSIRNLILEGAKFYIPNVFTPNHDGINDVFSIFVYPAINIDLDYFAIFDRFGDMTYETFDWPVHWNGEDQGGKLFQPAMFAYVFIYHCGSVQHVRHGDLTLIR